MFDNICTLPLPADVFAQAIHPTLPIISIGLSSGHVYTYRLPSTSSPTPAPTNGTSPNGNLKHPTTSEAHNAHDIETLWSTHRHKASVRALAFSTDGNTLFSAGSDGIIKAAETMTGRVRAKTVTPSLPKSKEPETPSVLCALSPRALVLGTDSGAVFVYDLAATSGTKFNAPTPKPTQTFHPHSTADEPALDEAITSITALPPSSTSSSGTSRAWISTAGASVAVTDLRKGIVSCSSDQGDLLGSSCCSTSTSPGAVAGVKRKANDSSAAREEGKILVGSANGLLTLWERSEMSDRTGTIVVARDGGGVMEENTIDCLAPVPDDPSRSPGLVAAGLGNGTIVFVKLRKRGGEVWGSVKHDEQTAEGVTVLGFDVEGRMVSGGGSVLKVWHAKKDREGDHGEDEEEMEEEVVEGMEESGEDQESEQESSEEEVKKRKKKKRKKGKEKAVSRFGDHGVMAFADLE